MINYVLIHYNYNIITIMINHALKRVKITRKLVHVFGLSWEYPHGRACANMPKEEYPKKGSIGACSGVKEQRAIFHFVIGRSIFFGTQNLYRSGSWNDTLFL